MTPDVRTTVAGFAGALLVLAVLAWVVGFESLLDSLSMARRSVIVGVLAAAAVWLTAWALALRTVLGALGARISPLRAVAVYAGALFANNVTPFGQAGGEPVTAILISETADTEYETGLAAIASADALNFVPSTAFAFVGVSYFTVVLAAGEEIRWATAAVVALTVALPVVGYLVWTNHDRVETGVGRALTPLAQAIGRRVPRLGVPSEAAIEERIDSFFREIEVVATDRQTLVAALGLSTLGWLAQATALWLALYAIGVTAPFAAVLVAVPVGAIASVTPLPGGLGGIEAVLIALLVPLAGVSGATAAAAVVIHRGAIYWLPTLVGAGVSSALGAQRV
ncbi:MAG: hypothetical protein ACI8UR_001088 [Natronomonas sp.]|jgi:uncharacterized protein (TIRG00374 family)|uniref:lysylphosphatidylglycerol synthase transmembrane domain-containing protein n=1 Tax=Natronomonas sp. TaxID=2184060 RepID=UPI0039891C53